MMNLDELQTQLIKRHQLVGLLKMFYPLLFGVVIGVGIIWTYAHGYVDILHQQIKVNANDASIQNYLFWIFMLLHFYPIYLVGYFIFLFKRSNKIKQFIQNLKDGKKIQEITYYKPDNPIRIKLWGNTYLNLIKLETGIFTFSNNTEFEFPVPQNCQNYIEAFLDNEEEYVNTEKVWETLNKN